MSSRSRFHVLLVVTALAATALTLVSNAGDWSRAELYGAAAGLIVLLGAVGLPWIEMAPDGAWRRSTPR
jgi:hypothetical protein